MKGGISERLGLTFLAALPPYLRNGYAFPESVVEFCRGATSAVPACVSGVEA